MFIPQNHGMIGVDPVWLCFCHRCTIPVWMWWTFGEILGMMGMTREAFSIFLPSGKLDLYQVYSGFMGFLC